MSQQINLYNPVFLVQKKHFSATAMVQALAMLVAGMALIDALALYQAHGLEKILAQTSTAAERQREQLVAMGKQFSDRGTSRKLADDIARAEEQLRTRSQLLADMTTGVSGNAEGYSGLLSALARQAAPGVWLTGVQVDGKSGELVLRGKALQADQVPAYVRGLSKEPAFAGRAVSALRVAAKESARGPVAEASREPAAYVEFSVSIPAAGEAKRGDS